MSGGTSVLDAIGNTPLAELRRVVPRGAARVVVKLESANPTGSNPDGEAGYHPLGEELWEQAGGKVDAFVQAVGTAHALHGSATALRRRNPKLHVTAVEPAESAVLSGGPSGAHRIEGIGIGFVPPLFRRGEVDEVLAVPTDAAKAMARRLAAEEAIFAGTSSGANVIAALRVAERLGAGATVATIVVDSGLRYLSTDLFGAAA